MPTYSLTVAGAAQTIHLPSLDFLFVSNGRDVLNVTITSANAAYRPALGAEVILTEDGTDIFGGIIAKTTETGIAGLPDGSIATEITCDAFNVWADRRFVTETFAASSTLESILTTLVADYLADFGVTLDGSQATGPTLADEWVISGEPLSSVLQTLTELAEDYGTGESWLWEIDAAKTFRMIEAGSVAAPIDFVDGDGHQKGDLIVTRSREKYANRVIIKFGPTGNVAYTDSFTGDGITDTFTLSYPIAFGAIHPYSWAGYVTNASINETLDVAGQGATWEYDPANHTIERVSGAPANLAAISINYDVTFPQIVTAEDATEITNNGLQELVFEYPGITDKAVAESLAASILAKSLATKTEVLLETYEPGIAPGQSTTITASKRNVNGDFLITEVRGRSDAVGVRRTVISVQGDVFRGSFRDVYRAWLDGGAKVTSTTPTVVGTGYGGATAPANPNRSVQFNNSGAFGGSSDFLWQSTGTYSGFPANLLVKVVDESRYNLALVGPSTSSDVWLAQVFGGGGIIWNGGVDWDVQPSRDYTVTAGREFIVDIGDNFLDQIHLRGIVSAHGLALSAIRTVATTYEVDITAGSSPIHTIYAVPTTNDTNIVFPSLTTGGANPATGQYRVLCTRHDGTANTVRVRPKTTSESINGTSEYVMAPGESVIWQGLTGTGAGWKGIARFSTST